MYSTGQQVVCINAEFTPFIHSIYTALPAQDHTYTIRDVLPGINEDNKTHEVAVLLEELVNPLNRAAVPQELAFNVERFAPLDPNYEVEIEEEREPTKKKQELVAV